MIGFFFTIYLILLLKFNKYISRVITNGSLNRKSLIITTQLKIQISYCKAYLIDQSISSQKDLSPQDNVNFDLNDRVDDVTLAQMRGLKQNSVEKDLHNIDRDKKSNLPPIEGRADYHKFESEAMDSSIGEQMQHLNVKEFDPKYSTQNSEAIQEAI